MKFIIAILFALVMPLSHTAEPEFSLKIGEDGVVNLDSSDWDIVSQELNYDFYLAKVVTHVGNDYYRLYSWTEFREAEEYSYLKAPVKRMLSYGFMNCSDGTFSLMGSLYLDQNNKVLDSTGYDFGQYLVEVLTPNTSRNKAYKKVCVSGHNI
jgi:hypothetical protein